jgi:hypothetical protein
MLANVVDVPAEVMGTRLDGDRIGTRTKYPPGIAGLPNIPVPVTTTEATGSTPNHLDEEGPLGGQRHGCQDCYRSNQVFHTSYPL